MVFLRGEAPNREGWSPNPSADPNGPEHAIWAARTNAPGGAWRVVDATNPELAPDGSSILFVKDGQIYRAKLSPVKPASEMDRGEKAFITEWGVQSEPEVFAGRQQDRVRQYAHRSQLHRGVRHCDANREVHVAERRLRHRADVAARQQAPDLHAAAGLAVWTADAAGRGRNRSAARTCRASSHRSGGRTGWA